MSKKNLYSVVAMVIVTLFMLSLKFPATSGEAQYPPPTPIPSQTPLPTEIPAYTLPDEYFTHVAPAQDIEEMLENFPDITSPSSPTFPNLTLHVEDSLWWYIELPPEVGPSNRITIFEEEHWTVDNQYCVVRRAYYDGDLGGWYEIFPPYEIENGFHRSETLETPRLDCYIDTTPPFDTTRLDVSSDDTEHPKYIFAVPLLRYVHLVLGGQ